MDPYIPATGANRSPYDARTIQHEMASATPLVKGGYEYLPEDIDNQHKVGICTAISLTQNAGKYFKKKYSPDFQYLLQKKYYDLGWWEGSSIFNALKVGKKYGFLPIDEFTQVTEADRELPYNQYIAKLQAIPEAEIQRLLALCVDKLSGYAEVDVSSSQSVARAINDSKTGILCRYTASRNWYTAISGRISWSSVDIDPLRPDGAEPSGHAIGAVQFDYTVNRTQVLANTWGIFWNDQNFGKAHVDFGNYQMTEAWIPYYDFVPPVPPFAHNFLMDMKYNDRNLEVEALQKALSTLGYFTVTPTGWYGSLTADAVLKFQLERIPTLSWYEKYILKGTRVGPKTRGVLNSIFNK